MRWPRRLAAPLLWSSAAPGRATCATWSRIRRGPGPCSGSGRRSGSRRACGRSRRTRCGRRRSPSRNGKRRDTRTGPSWPDDRGVHPEIVLPCLDEADALPTVLAGLPPGWSVLVVDNGSTDGTADVARALGARVVTEARRGYGAAVHAGLVGARAELVAVLDGDGSLDSAVLPRMAAAVVGGDADLAVGRRVPQ